MPYVYVPASQESNWGLKSPYLALAHDASSRWIRSASECSDCDTQCQSGMTSQPFLAAVVAMKEGLW